MFPLLSATPWFYFYPRPPRGGRLIVDAHKDCPMAISIHALREEGDEAAGGSEAS